MDTQTLTLAELRRRLTPGTQIRHVWVQWREAKTGDGTINVLCTVTAQGKEFVRTTYGDEPKNRIDLPKSEDLRATANGFEFLDATRKTPYTRYEWVTPDAAPSPQDAPEDPTEDDSPYDDGEADTAPAAATGQKGGSLDGISAESLASSKHVLKRTRGGGTTGLQQFYTPAPVAEFIRAVNDPRGRFVTCDLTAGDGALLAPYDADKRVGVEIDAQQIQAAKKQKRGYRALHGDLLHLFPLLSLSGLRFSRLVLNPPFGLDDWQQATVNGGRKGNSVRIAFQMGLALMAPGGMGALIAGTSRLDSVILSDPDLSRAVYAVVDLPRMFAGVSLPCSVAFFADPAHRRKGKPGLALRTTPPTADLAAVAESLALRIQAERREAFPTLPGYFGADAEGIPAMLHQIQDEHGRRLAQRLGTAAQDVTLDTRGRIDVRLSPLAQKGILATPQGSETLKNTERLHGQRVNYFAMNGREWKQLESLADAGLLTIDAATRGKVEAVIARARALSVPVYPLKPQQRLGYLSDAGRIDCTRTDTRRGFVAGNSYAVGVRSRIAQSERKDVQEVHGPLGKSLKELTWIREAKVLDIALTPEGGYAPVKLSEGPEDIGYLLAHFAVPDPGDLMTHSPAEIADRQETLRRFEEAMLRPLGFTLKRYQRDDVARLLLKRGGLLSWEQGLGKTLGAMLFALACEWRGETDGNALFVVPQDLIPQWQAEAEKFFGRELVWVRTRAQAREAKRRIAEQHRLAKAERRKGPGEADPFFDVRDAGQWYVTHFEALSIGDTSGKVTLGGEAVRTQRGRVPLPAVRVKTVTKRQTVKGGYRDGQWHKDRVETWEATLTSRDLCPRCYQCAKVETDTGSDWDGTNCARCGYAHTALRLKTAAAELSTAFRAGVVVIDEATKIKGDSLQSLAVRGLRAGRKLVMTGTPVDKGVADLFHLLGWALGYSSPRFPYAYDGGLDLFVRDFCVTERLGGPKGGRLQILPEVTNLSMLWKMLSGAVVRRRKDETGETLVTRTFRPVTVPMGTQQAAQYRRWLDGFPGWYCAQNPEADADMVRMNAAVLGQLHKLEYASTLPTADPDAAYFGVGVSDWTPKNLKVLELAAFHAARGEKVLIGSDVMLTGRFLSDALNAKGIPAAHILDTSPDGKVQTKGPAARAGAVAAFRTGETRVLCAGVQSINLGHNMDHASVVILTGLPWKYGTLDQFLARVHRLSSKRPVTVYVVMADGSLDERKWDLLMRETKTSNLALDGELQERSEQSVSLQDVLSELVTRGLPVKATVEEGDCFRLWQGQDFPLRPVGSPIDGSQDAPAGTRFATQSAPAADAAPAFTFQTVVPKKVRNAPAIGSMFAQIQQGALFAL